MTSRLAARIELPNLARLGKPQIEHAWSLVRGKPAELCPVGDAQNEPLAMVSHGETPASIVEAAKCAKNSCNTKNPAITKFCRRTWQTLVTGRLERLLICELGYLLTVFWLAISFFRIAAQQCRHLLQFIHTLL